MRFLCLVASVRCFSAFGLFCASVYILVALVLEERDLTALFGDKYREYRRQTGKLHPFKRYRPSA